MHGTIDSAENHQSEDRAGHRPIPSRFRTSTSAIRNCSGPIPSGRISTGCARKIRCITARTACSGRTGRSPSTTTSWTSRPITRCSRRDLARRHHHPRRPRRPAPRSSSPWIRRGTTRSARPWRRCSRRHISTSSRSISASGRLNASTTCRRTRCSTGSIKVSIELTTQMLATLFDFPWEDRRKLTRWSDVATDGSRLDGIVATEDERAGRAAWSVATYFDELWNERVEPAAEGRSASR